MHTVQVLASLKPGGSERVAAELAESSIRGGQCCTLTAAGSGLSGRLPGFSAALADRPVGRRYLSTMPDPWPLPDGLKVSVVPALAAYRFLMPVAWA